MAYDPLTGKYTPDKALKPTVTIGGAQAGYKPAGAPNFITGAGIPEAAPAPKAVPYRGFRAAEDESNIGAPVYTPSSLAQTGEFIEEEEDKRS
jgi:hypothetical protein